jgi:predicted negative regulator of RcsB-dependent stress response
MQDLETEEQQVEAIKKFWKENGIAIILGAVIGLGGLSGWRYYSAEQLAAKEQASVAYETVVEELAQDSASINSAVDFVNESGSSGYAVLAALQVAKEAVVREDFAEATKQLKWAAENSKDDVIKSVANIRLSRIYKQEENYDQALSTLASVEQVAFSAQVNEIKGDVYQAQGNFDKARAAYSASIEDKENNTLVQMKLDNLAAERVDGE